MQRFNKIYAFYYKATVVSERRSLKHAQPVTAHMT